MLMRDPTAVEFMEPSAGSPQTGFSQASSRECNNNSVNQSLYHWEVETISLSFGHLSLAGAMLWFIAPLGNLERGRKF